MDLHYYGKRKKRKENSIYEEVNSEKPFIWKNRFRLPLVFLDKHNSNYLGYTYESSKNRANEWYKEASKNIRNSEEVIKKLKKEFAKLSNSMNLDQLREYVYNL